MFLLVGDSLKSSLVAIVAVDHDALKTFAAAEGINVMALYTVSNDQFFFFRVS